MARLGKQSFGGSSSKAKKKSSGSKPSRPKAKKKGTGRKRPAGGKRSATTAQLKAQLKVVEGVRTKLTELNDRFKEAFPEEVSFATRGMPNMLL